MVLLWWCCFSLIFMSRNTSSTAGLPNLSRSLLQSPLCSASLHFFSNIIQRLTVFVTAATLTAKRHSKSKSSDNSQSKTHNARCSTTSTTAMNRGHISSPSTALQLSSSSSSSSSESDYVYDYDNEPANDNSSFSTSDLDVPISPLRKCSIAQNEKEEKRFEDEIEGQQKVGFKRHTMNKDQLDRIESYSDGIPNNDHFPFYPPILENATSSYRSVHFGSGASTSTSSTASSTCTSSASVASNTNGYLEDSMLPALPPALNPQFSRQGSAEFFGRGLDDTDEAQFDDEQKIQPTDDEEESATRSLYFARQPSIERTTSNVSTVYNGFDEETTRGLHFSPPDDEDTPQESEMKRGKTINTFDAPTYQPSMLAFSDRAASVATTITSAVSRTASLASNLSPRSALSRAASTNAPLMSLPSIRTPSMISPMPAPIISPQSLNRSGSSPFGSCSPAISNPVPLRPPPLLAQSSGQSSSVHHSMSASSLESSVQDMSLADADSEELPPPSHLVLALRRQNAMISEDHSSPLPEGRPNFPMRGASYSNWSSSTSSNQRSVSHSARSSANPNSLAMDTTWTSSYSASSSPSALAGHTLSAPPTPPTAPVHASTTPSSASGSATSVSCMSASAGAPPSGSSRTNS